MEETLDQISPIQPINFFAILLDLQECHWGKELKKNHYLPDFSDLLAENSFASVFLGWNVRGLQIEITVFKPFEDCFFPEFQKGDSIELFIDTRDLKSAGFLTRFCHHFVILPKAIDGIQAREVTAFRTDDRHELCDPEKISVKGSFERKKYHLQILLPSESLHGYDPEGFDRLGFTYRINGMGRDPQHFSLSSHSLVIEQQPSKWASMQMRKR